VLRLRACHSHDLGSVSADRAGGSICLPNPVRLGVLHVSCGVAMTFLFTALTPMLHTRLFWSTFLLKRPMLQQAAAAAGRMWAGWLPGRGDAWRLDSDANELSRSRDLALTWGRGCPKKQQVWGFAPVLGAQVWR
jgi:hypothetical protein